ncbi:hypothetical protein L218DRAFT_676129 [Marasmius fiardii PR-910]|nr:hypothetical protein L218DRAFT_676129 [Marasmius fiardii PR-910]
MNRYTKPGFKPITLLALPLLSSISCYEYHDFPPTCFLCLIVFFGIPVFFRSSLSLTVFFSPTYHSSTSIKALIIWSRFCEKSSNVT